MQRALPYLLLLILPCTALAAEVRYISDQIFIPLRSGAGNDYRIIHRGLPSGTRLEQKQLSEDGDFAKVRLEDGTEGWLRVQYLTEEAPARNKLTSAQARASSLSGENEQLKETTEALSSEKTALLDQISSSEEKLAAVMQELAELKQISGNALQADADNQRLTLEAEELRSEIDTVKVENLRLRENLDSEAFTNGALAVLLGVIITLVVPRLWPKRRKSSSWA